MVPPFEHIEIKRKKCTMVPLTRVSELHCIPR